MSAVKDQVFEDWRPLGQSLTLVRAPVSRVAPAFEQEGVRLSEYICGGADQFAWVRHASIADLFDEEGMMELLVRFGINPWREATYDFQTRCFRMLHSKLFESSETIAFEQVRDRAQSARAQKK